MSLTSFVVWKHWASNRLRTALTLLGIALGVAIVVAIFVMDHNTIQTRFLQQSLERGPVDLEAMPGQDGVLVLGAVDGIDAIAFIRPLADGPVIFSRGRALALRGPDYAQAIEALAGGDDVRAPMPGKVIEVKVKAGQEVRRGDPLVVLEAMKMEHTLAAPRDGKVAEVSATPGHQTTDGAILVRLEPLPE